MPVSYTHLDVYKRQVRDILHLDSSNIQPEEWQVIARHVFESKADYDGIIITHGTDTMAYTASVLSLSLIHILTASASPPRSAAPRPGTARPPVLRQARK